MRKSSAPSFRSMQNTHKLITKLVPTVPGNQLLNALPSIPNAARSTASILGLLASTTSTDRPAQEESNTPLMEYGNEEILSYIPSDKLESNNLYSSSSCNMKNPDTHSSVSQSLSLNKPVCSEENNQVGQKRIYTVVWGKQTTKKHKTYESDGTLEVVAKHLILKDEEGKIIGRASAKTETIEEGTRLNVGSKAVEIVELCSSVQENVGIKRPNVEITEPTKPASRPMKKIRKVFVPTNVTVSTKGNYHLDYEPLMMTKPSHEHQWKWNENRLPVVDISVDPCLARVLRPHQRAGVVFLYETVMGMRQLDHHGAILADEMGLGKTLQCITLIWMLLKHGPYGNKAVVQRVLVVTPSSLVVNWQKEFLQWLGRERIQPFVVDQKHKPKDYVKLGRVPVMLISYEMFVRCFDDIQPIKFDLLICDEGHRLKNTSIRTSTLLNQLECKRRVLLTGTPIQNDLQEFFALVDFVNPGLLGTSHMFHKYFEEPIVASRQPDIDDDVSELGEDRAVELNTRTNGFILRRTQEVINKYLPTKQESVIFCSSSSLQQVMYRAAVKYWYDRVNIPGGGGVAHLSVITTLKKICNHPMLVNNQKQGNSTNVGSKSSRALPGTVPQLETLPEEGNLALHLSKILSQSVTPISSPEHSGKLSVVCHLLQQLNDTKERIILVSYFTQTLDMFATLCEDKKYKFCRLDGSTPSSQRMDIVNRFNAPYSPYFVFLLSARAGGVGLNLTGASRLVLYDSDWNPASDLQAMSRIWRDGQKTSVHIYRLLTACSIEEKIFQRQISKTGLSGAVVDPQSSDAIRLSNEELKDLFTFNEDGSCLTHDLLDCECPGTGTIPGSPESPGDTLGDPGEGFSDDRECQLEVSEDKPAESCLRMNQLYEWEHHKGPISQATLEEMGLLLAASLITFIFRNNSTTQSNKSVKSET